MSARFSTNATLPILIAIALGMVLGLFYPGVAVEMKLLSDTFIKVVGLLMPFLLFVLVSTGVAGIKREPHHRHVVGRIVVYFQLMSLAALVLGMSTGWLFSLDHTAVANLDFDHLTPPVAPEKLLHELSATSISSSLYRVFTQSLVLQVMLVAVLCGLVLGRGGRVGNRCLGWLEAAVAGLFLLLRFILKFATLAAFGAMAFVVGKYGVSSVLPLLKFIVVIYLACAIFVILVFATIARLVGFKLTRLIVYLKEELLLVTFTGSSVAALPGCVSKLEALGCDRQLVRLVLTTGYTFNLAGTNIYLTTAIMFLAHLAGVEIAVPELLAVLVICLFTSLGSTSVAGSALFTLIATLNILQLVPLEGVGLLLGVERLMKCRSLTNVLGNCVACLAICGWQKAIDREVLKRELSH
ncbi:cation:dicarboxylase symporter family transporter [Pseudomonas sp. CBSPBW29]|uniref:cation:dicarboxylate symporter family transporter n=1 Tax=unclassified Pseudomonas TaxID=196821 RepID=UPI0021ACE443|nr:MULTISPECIES: cation:dicarboxylase symporter family transporter [unclassified Pseudomonas]WEL43039.1 cation:dicarboxylase symporter family transporter [Pseudomonas sp. CBSPBW29]WEL64107.1 cation:dicarboxylase symporter family transporter [Pseudomonas sp. CBSPGW29]WEL73295.1 cation:dicarboxylase symporter family transporter [Pseudomonas sp. CBSPCGW29]WEL74609.1 cation:dicarboxylase symporter family transporter [Pseudomonas sp. CBSPAW29]WEL81151.1 cation:dicarboxylase symporter family transpo